MSETSASFCEGSSITIGDEEYTEAGNYTQTLMTQDGCDSILTIILSTLPQDSTILETSICPGESVLISGIEYTEPGVYEESYTNQSSCDSIVTIVIERENACVDCDLTEGGNFKTKVDITKMVSGNVLEESTQEKNGVLKALLNKRQLSKALILEYKRPYTQEQSVQEETKRTMETVRAMKAGRTMSYWISV